MKDGEKKGRLIVNADDWGLDRATTDSIAECLLHGSVQSASAMVFMEDSARAAQLAIESGFDCGLHLNLTVPFTGGGPSARLKESQRKVIAYLRRNKWASLVFHPGLRNEFESVVRSQIEEFEKLYGRQPNRIDGHHHAHLAANVQLQTLVPQGTVSRRFFTFGPGESRLSRRIYSSMISALLHRRHHLTDYLFSIEPLQPVSRLEKIMALAQAGTVELETHPARESERDFLLGPEFARLTGGVHLARYVEVFP